MNLYRLICKDPKIILVTLLSVDGLKISAKLFKWSFILVVIFKIIGLFTNTGFWESFDAIVNLIFEDSSYSKISRSFIGVLFGAFVALYTTTKVNEKQNLIKNNLEKNKKIFTPLYDEISKNKFVLYFDGQNVYRSLEKEKVKNEETEIVGYTDSLIGDKTFQIVMPKFFKIANSSDYLLIKKPLKNYYSDLEYALNEYFFLLRSAQDEMKQYIDNNFKLIDKTVEVNNLICRITEYILEGNAIKFDGFWRLRFEPNNKKMPFYEISNMMEIKYLKELYANCIQKREKIKNLLEYIIRRNINKGSESFKWLM